MKKFFFGIAVSALTLSLASCGGGWNEESKASANKICKMGMEISYPDDAAAICDCYVNKLVEKFPKADQTPEQSSALMDECSADAKKKADEKFQQEMDAMINSMDTTGTAVGDAVEGAIEEVKEGAEKAVETMKK